MPAIVVMLPGEAICAAWETAGREVRRLGV